MRVLILVLIFILPSCAKAEELAEKLIDASGIEALEDFAAGFSVEKILNFISAGDIPDVESIIAYLLDALSEPVHLLRNNLLQMALPILLLMFLGLFLSPKRSGGIRFACRMVLYLTALRQISTSFAAARQCLQTTLKFSQVASPVLIALLTAGGMRTTSALITPSAALAGNLIEVLFQRYGLPICTAAACTSVMGNVGGVDLNRLTKLLKKLLNWGCGLAVCLFTTLILMKGNLAGTSDNLLIRTAKYTVDSAAGFIGSGVSDAWESYLLSLNLARNAVGFTGAAALLSVCLAPILRLFACMAGFIIASVLLDSGGEKPAAGAIEHLAGVCQMMLMLCGGAMVIWIILVGSVMSLF